MSVFVIHDEEVTLRLIESSNNCSGKGLLPGGLAWIWWEVRTNFTAPAKIKWRLRRLREAIEKLESYRFGPAVRARKSRLPSITCQVTRPGMPIARSRNRAISEIANAMSPGMPSKLPITR
jgi:hypothetical protein